MAKNTSVLVAITLFAISGFVFSECRSRRNEERRESSAQEVRELKARADELEARMGRTKEELDHMPRAGEAMDAGASPDR